MLQRVVGAEALPGVIGHVIWAGFSEGLAFRLGPGRLRRRQPSKAGPLSSPGIRQLSVRST